MRPSDMSAEAQAALDRWIAGTPWTADAETLSAWAANVPRRRAVLTAFARAPRPAWPDADTVAARDAVLAMLRQRDQYAIRTDRHESLPGQPRFAKKPPIPSAASAAHGLRRVPSDAASSRSWLAHTPAMLFAFVIVMVGFVGWSLFLSSKERRVNLPERTYATDVGQRAEIHLRDGTRVVLAPRSRLDILTGFDASHRTVALTGEAYFSVANVAGAPFIVKTGALETRVLGTVFDVRHYGAHDDVRVAVVSGKVATGWTISQKTVTLTAGMVGRITDSTAVIAITYDPAMYTDWTNGKLTFRDAPVAEVLSTLGAWYGFRFRLADSSLASERVTTTLADRTPSTVLRAISLLLHVTPTFDGTTDGMTIVTLHKFRAVQPTAPSKRDRQTSLIPRIEVGR